MAKVEQIRQIVKLKQVMRRWKALSLLRRGGAAAAPPPGHLAVYVGVAERRRFVIPTRFLALPVFGPLLKRAEDEFGFQSQGALVLPCDPDAFAELVALLRRDEARFRGIRIEALAGAWPDEPCGGGERCSSVVAPLLQKAEA